MNNTLPMSIPEGMQCIPVGMQDYVHAYFGLWAMADLQFEGMRAMARTFDLGAHLARLGTAPPPAGLGEGTHAGLDEVHRSAAQRRLMASIPGLESAGAFDGYLTADGIAVIELRGTLMKFASSLSGGTSTVRVRRAVREAVADERVKAVLLVVDSPGGTVAGTPELADEVAAASAKKPVWAYAEDLMASAAYWVSSQCARIGANRTAMVGSLGTLMVLYDYSSAFKEHGIEPKVYKTGKRKGAGTQGVEIGAEDDAYFQSLIEECNTHFKGGVGAARPRIKIDEVFADAGVYLAAQAWTLGLIDQVCTLEQFYSALVKAVTRPSAPARAITDQSPVSAQDDTAPAPDPVVVTPAQADIQGDPMAGSQPTGTTPGAEGKPSYAEAKSFNIEGKPCTAAGGAQPAEPTPATIAQLKAAFPKAGNDFYVAQLEAGATTDQARLAYTAQLEARVEAADQTLAQQAAALAAAQASALPSTTGAPPGVTIGAAVPAHTATAPAHTATVPVHTAAATPVPTGAVPIESRRREGGENEGTAAAELDRLAKEMVAARPGLSLLGARQKVLGQDADLRERYSAEAAELRRGHQQERLRQLAIGR